MTKENNINYKKISILTYKLEDIILFIPILGLIGEEF